MHSHEMQASLANNCDTTVLDVCCAALQFVDGMKILLYDLMDVNKQMEKGNEMPEERVLCHYASCASQLVMELVWKVQKVCSYCR